MSEARDIGVDLASVDRLWRAANYLSVGQLYLRDNPLLERPLQPSDIKRRLLGHWGTTPGLNFVFAHVDRLIVERDLQALMVIGPGHGGPAALAHAWLEGSYGELDSDVVLGRAGMRRLFEQFSFPRGVPSHVAPVVPGSIHEGGELGYSLAHAFGAAFDHPDLVVACVVGDGEAETGPLSAAWHGPTFLDPVHDGAVLPILHLNGHKIDNPSVWSRRGDDVSGYLAAHGWEPIVVDCVDLPHEDAHRRAAVAFDTALDGIAAIQRRARDDRGTADVDARWPVIVLRSLKGWTGPDTVDGEPVEGTARSHQIPLEAVRERSDHREQLEAWLRSYAPHELFDGDGVPRDDVVGWLPSGDRRLGSTPYANGGRLLADLDLPPLESAAVDVDESGSDTSEPTRHLGRWLAVLFERTATSRNFRIFGPDETTSNRLDAVYDVTGKAWQLPTEPDDAHLDRHGRIMEVLSEHQCQGWLEGYLLTGRHGLFATYEAFVHVVDSMFNQHSKWLQASSEVEWRAPIASLNYLLTSHVWRQDHNGFSHQDPGFIDHVTAKNSPLVSVYLPPDTNTLLVVAEHCLASRHGVNVIVSGKQPTPSWLPLADARRHVERGLGIWDVVGDPTDPDLVMVCAGDIPTIEAVAAIAILEKELPELRVRLVNVVDLLRLQHPDDRNDGMPEAALTELLTPDRPILFAFHGYPWLIHRLMSERSVHPNLHVRGYRESGSTTTPFDMVVRNELDRFHLVLDAIRLAVDEGRRDDLGDAADELRGLMEEWLDRHLDQVTSEGVDLDVVADWRWDPET